MLLIQVKVSCHATAHIWILIGWRSAVPVTSCMARLGAMHFHTNVSFQEVEERYHFKLTKLHKI